MINDLLPHEMMMRIFQMLDNKDLSNVASVCRKWRKMGECLSAFGTGTVVIYVVNNLDIVKTQLN